MTHETDRCLTAFCDAQRKLWEYERCGCGLTTVPSSFANYVGGRIMRVQKEGVRNWIDDIVIPTGTFKSNSNYSLNLQLFTANKAVGKSTKIRVLFLGDRMAGNDHRPLRYQSCS